MTDQISEKHRVGLTYMFSHMTAWSMMWDITWEFALEECNNDVGRAFLFLSEFISKREAISINCALRSAGYTQRVTSLQ